MNHFVLVGGWAHQLHRLRTDADPLAGESLTTNDCDVAVPTRMLDPGKPTLAERLASEGFESEFADDGYSGFEKFRLATDRSFKLEFITPRVGDGRRAAGKGRSQWRVSGIKAEPLRYVRLAFVQPWECKLSVDGSRQISVPVIHPVPFILGKLLVSRAPDRPASDQAKDLFYAIESLQTFSHVLEGDEFQEVLANSIKALPRKWKNELLRAISTHFNQNPNQPGPTLVQASEIGNALGRGEASGPTQLRAIGRQGLEMLIGNSILNED